MAKGKTRLRGAAATAHKDKEARDRAAGIEPPMPKRKAGSGADRKHATGTRAKAAASASGAEEGGAGPIVSLDDSPAPLVQTPATPAGCEDATDA